LPGFGAVSVTSVKPASQPRPASSTLVRRAWLVWLAGAACRAFAAEPADFGSDVLPVLSDKCFHCHGPDASSRKAKLRLDLEEEVRKPRADGAALIVPGDADASLLIQRITSTDPDEVMPPPDFVKKLSPSEVAALRAWVEQGAKWEAHWAHQPVRRPPLPVNFNHLHPVDAFIDAALAKAGLTPNPRADAATLRRRAALDLTGLPPDSKAATDLPGLLPQLFRSPHYGERMAWDWLDLARYADTHGFQKDNLRSMWRWRDWVVEAFNNNLPFDQFTILQLAGDLLPEATIEQILPTGFNRNHRLNAEAGAIDEEYRVEYVLDRVETTATAWMGLTAGCARCHDHKYDPLSQREFFALAAFFNNLDERGNDGVGPVAEPSITLPVAGMENAVAAAKSDLKKAATALAAAAESADLAAWSKQQRQRLATGGMWRVLEPARVSGRDKDSTFTPLSDGSILFGGANPLNDVQEARLTVRDGLRLHRLRLEALPDPRLTGGSLARSFDGAFLLSGLDVEVNGAAQQLRALHATQTSEDGPPHHAIDSDPLTGWRVPGGLREPVRALFELEQPVEVKAGSEVVIRLRYESREEQFIIGRFRISAGAAALQLDAEEMPQSLAEAVNLGDPEALLAAYRETAPELAPWRAARDAARHALTTAKEAATTQVMVMRERPGEPRPTHVLKRGLYDQPGEQVRPDVPAFLGLPLPDGAPGDRLALARWLVDPRHPLTARVTVNRLWQMLFGAGLVRTPEDFGFQGERPTHPELLDWLAAEFIENGWDIQAMLRLLMTSDTYARSAHVTPEMLERDPDNRLLARASRTRLPAPVIRDQALAVSGLLAPRLGGPPVRPYQPPGLWEAVAGVNSNTTRYIQDHGESLHRRSLYTLWKRSVPPPNMMLFDASAREVCSVARPRTNSPLQALVTLNDTTYAEAARALARRALAEAEDDDARVARLWRIVLARDPDARERDSLATLLQRQRVRYQAAPGLAESRVRVGESTVPDDLDITELAAWTELAEVMLNLDATLTRP
jgi:hypothetical protein